MKSKEDASKLGFSKFNRGNTLCPDYSNSNDPTELTIDLAARQLEHCLEAWNFLSQAGWALVSAHTNQAIHMAYYAEVRAANSLFASSGIAVKSFPNYYLSKTDAREEIRGPAAGTHSLIRNFWPHWCKRTDAKAIFANLKVTQSISLNDVWNALGLGNRSQSRLLVWGYELTNLAKDHESRNMASYDVLQSYSGITQAQSKSSHKILEMVWDHLQPAGMEGQLQFEVIYARYLVWAYCLDFATQSSDEGEDFKTVLNRVLQKLSQNTGVPVTTLSYTFDLDSTGDPSFMLFDIASRTSTTSENVFLRAFILARLATSKLNENISFSGSDIALEWAQKWLRELGVLKDGEDPEDVVGLSEIYAEQAQAIAAQAQNTLWDSHAADAANSSRLNTALCWSLAF